jgi:hypothetical protein
VTQAAPNPRPSSPLELEVRDIDILTRLSRVSIDLHQLRQAAAEATGDLRSRRSSVVLAEALLLRANGVAVESLGGRRDRVTIEVLDDAIAGNRLALESAACRAANATDSVTPLLPRLKAAISSLQGEADELRAELSPLAERAVVILARKKVLPIVAGLDHQTCGECHLRLPTALAGSVALKTGLHRCPHCKRILVPAAPSAQASAS